MPLTIKQALKAGLCAGCGYCEAAGKQQSITMEIDSEGFLRPSGLMALDDQELLKRIENVCPAIHAENVLDSESAKGTSFDRLWGGYLYCGVGYSTDPEVRYIGSSGGVITELSAWLLDAGRVDHVVTTDYHAQNPIRTETHVTSDPGVVRKCAGSKYAPSSPLSSLKSICEKHGRYAVIGKPCDITALRRAKNAGDPLVDDIDLLISFFCAGVPSEHQNMKLLRRLGVGDVSKVKSFRHRGHGWPGMTAAVTDDGEVHECTYNESWGTVLNKGLQFRCKICADGIGEEADIVCADAWYGDEAGYPIFEEAEGRSLILARTAKGASILQECIEANRVAASPINVREIDKMQPGQLRRRRHLLSRVRALRVVGHRTMRYNPKALIGYQQGMSFYEKGVAFLGAWRRVLKARKRKNKSWF